MLITEGERASRISTCLEAAHRFLLSEATAVSIIERQLRCVGKHWSSVCDEAELSLAERNFFWERQFFNPYAFTALEDDYGTLATLVDELRKGMG